MSRGLSGRQKRSRPRREQTTRDVLILSLLASVAVLAINMLITRDLLGTLIMAPLFFVVMFFSMTLSNRVSRRIAQRFRPAAPPELEPPPEATSERPQHARRRRDRRRRRGHGRRG